MNKENVDIELKYFKNSATIEMETCKRGYNKIEM